MPLAAWAAAVYDGMDPLMIVGLIFRVRKCNQRIVRAVGFGILYYRKQ